MIEESFIIVCRSYIFFISHEKTLKDTSCIRIMIIPRKGNVARRQQCGDAKSVILQKNWLAHVGHLLLV